MEIKPQSGVITEIQGRKYFHLHEEEVEFEAELEEAKKHFTRHESTEEQDWWFRFDMSCYEVSNEVNGYYFNQNDCCLNPCIVFYTKKKSVSVEITVAQVKKCGMMDYGLHYSGATFGGVSSPWYNNPESSYFPTTDDAVLHAIESCINNEQMPAGIKAELEKLRSQFTPSGISIIPSGTQLELQFA